MRAGLEPLDLAAVTVASCSLEMRPFFHEGFVRPLRIAAPAMPRNWQEDEGTYIRLLKRCLGRRSGNSRSSAQGFDVRSERILCASDLA